MTAPLHQRDPRGPSEDACLRAVMPPAPRHYGARNRPAARLPEGEHVYRQAVGELLKGIRLRKGITQIEAAAAILARADALSDWERGKSPMPDHAIARLVTLYGLNPADFEVPPPMMAETDRERAMWLRDRTASPERQAANFAFVMAEDCR